jgi:hypothetical protein
VGAPASKEDEAYRAAFGARIRDVCEYLGVKITALNKQIGLKSKAHLGNVVRLGAALSTEHTAKIVQTRFPRGRVNGHWLLTGEGAPLLPRAADDEDPCPNRALVLSRLHGVVSYTVLGQVRDVRMGPEADFPTTEWLRIALEYQDKYDGEHPPRRPVTAPPHSSGVQETVAKTSARRR